MSYMPYEMTRPKAEGQRPKCSTSGAGCSAFGNWPSAFSSLAPRACAWGSVVTFTLAISLAIGGCPPDDDDTRFPGYVNITDKSNGGAAYVGSNSCKQCHADQAALHALHPHASQLNPVRGGPPSFPQPGGGVPNPPTGFEWGDVSYVIGGYAKGAYFVDQQGFVLTTGLSGVPTVWQFPFGPNATTGGLAAYRADATSPLPYRFALFSHHTTGAAAQNPDSPQFQDNRPGLQGTWTETGVQCEACHGPGGGHFQTVLGQVRIDRGRIFVDPDGKQTCRACHTEPFGDSSGAIAAQDGFIVSHAQGAELAASGGHRDFSCTICHEPHVARNDDQTPALRNQCASCHASVNMAGHGGATLVRESDGYRETLTCESCHMSYAGRRYSSGSEALFDRGRVGDTRTHIFRISTAAADYGTLFTDDGTQVRRDDQGRAAVTVDFVCLRCHTGDGMFKLSLERAAEIAPNVHRLP